MEFPVRPDGLPDEPCQAAVAEAVMIASVSPPHLANLASYTRTAVLPFEAGIKANGGTVDSLVVATLNSFVGLFDKIDPVQAKLMYLASQLLGGAGRDQAQVPADGG